MNSLDSSNFHKEVKIQGIYRHYKGFLYQVLAVGTHTETLEPFVVYQALYGEKLVWIRPLAMFCEDMLVQESKMPRFKLEQ